MRSFLNSPKFARLTVGLAFLVGLFVAVAVREPLFGAAASVTIYAIGNALSIAAKPVDYRFGLTTLSVAEITNDLIKAFTQTFPILTKMGLDLRATTLKLNKQEIAHITSLPVASTYNAAAGGYGNGAQSARALLADVPVTPDQHPTCPLYWEHIDQISDDKNKYQEAIALTAYVLAKGVVDNVLAGVTTRNFSQEYAVAVADFDYDAITKITEKANIQKMMPTGRVMIVASAVASILDADARITSKDFSGQQTGGNGIRVFRNVGGFELIQEYPDFPTNNGAALAGITGVAATDVLTKAAHGLLTGDPFEFSALTGGGAELAIETRYWVIHVTANTFKLASSYANAVAGVAIDFSADITDATGHRAENLIAFAFDKRAIAVLAGIPEGFNSELMARLNIPQVMAMTPITEENSQMTMAGVSWQEAGTGKLLYTPTFVWGKGLGRQGTAASNVNVMTDYAGLRVVYPNAA